MIRPTSARLSEATTPSARAVALEEGPRDCQELAVDGGSGRVKEMVEYLCIASAHASKALEPGVGLTVHLSNWAYCPAGGSSDHDWFETGGIEIVGLTRVAPYADVTDDATAERSQPPRNTMSKSTTTKIARFIRGRPARSS
jgi:hypothetical protein